MIISFLKIKKIMIKNIHFLVNDLEVAYSF